MLSRADKILRSAGVVQTRLKVEQTLIAGFVFGLWWKYKPRPVAEIEQLLSLLRAIRSSTAELEAMTSDRDRLGHLSSKLEAERAGLQYWFKLGLWTFANAWILGAGRFAEDTDAARALLRNDDEVRKAGASLLGTLIDLGWSPDEAENFYVEKLVPFLYDDGHRKWVDRPDMAVMLDLRHKAKLLDTQAAQDSDSRRAAGAARALVSEVPVVGKALEILLFGAKK